MKAEEDTANASYYAFVKGISRYRRRRRGSQASSDSCMTAFDPSNGSDLTQGGGGLDSSEDSDSSDEEKDEEEEKEEEDLTSIYPQEDSDSGRDSDAYKPRSL